MGYAWTSTGDGTSSISECYTETEFPNVEPIKLGRAASIDDLLEHIQ